MSYNHAKELQRINIVIDSHFDLGNEIFNRTQMGEEKNYKKSLFK